jgi:K+-transporting ATPase ATPase C chain
MKSQFAIAFKSFLLLTLLTGVIYPLAITGISQVALNGAAEGSLLPALPGGSSPGSMLIGQSFQGKDQFWGRLSQTGPSPYNAAASGASNLGTSNPVLADNAKARLDALELDPQVRCPVDLVSSSGSGLDPDISPEAARVQIPRVAKATGKSPEELESLVSRLTEPPTFGVLGQARVNVVLLNMELKKLL